MKHFFSLILVLIIAITLTSCKIETLPFINKDTQTIAKDEVIKYQIDKVILSKGYQSIEPTVEVVKKSNDIRLLVSVGLLESSGVFVDKIVKKGNVINIHIVNEKDEENISLAVPQVVLDLKNTKSLNIDEVNFNIVNENFKPISIKLGLNEVINKVKLDFNVTANNSPEVVLSRVDDKLIWNITYNGIFDKDNPETPLVNLSVELDADTGNVLKSTKGLISSYIDEGHVLDYVMDKYFLYKQTDLDSNTSIETNNIWYYDIKKNVKTRLYHTNADITSASFSPDFKHISLIENNGTNSKLYLISRDEKKAYRVLFEEDINPTIVRWNDNHNLIILDNNANITNVYNYNIKNDNTELIKISDKPLTDIRIYKDGYILTEYNEDAFNNRILFTKDWKNFKFVDVGFHSRFVNKDMIAYLKKNEKNDKNLLYIYDLKNDVEYDSIDLNISSLFSLPNDELFIVEKNQGNKDYTIYEYGIREKSLNKLTTLNSDTIFYNKNKNLVYVDLVIPFESEKSEIIYSVDLSKLISTAP